MTALWFTHEQAEALIAATQQARPYEACGLLTGTGARVEAIIPIRNDAADPAHFYRLHDQEFTQALFQVQRSGQSLVAFYHSHPASAPIPSQEDIRQATYPDVAYVIVGFPHTQPELAAWRIAPGRVERLPLHIGTQPPPASPALSQAQKAAIMTAALLAFTFLILLSLSLLPPAPVIVTPLP